jgi:PAS domain S-box-containing protein
MAESIKIFPSSEVATTGALHVALTYAGFSGLWILVSDRAVAALVQDPAVMTLVSIAKGWVFVAVTATMLFIMVRRLVEGVASREAKLQALIHSIPDLVWLKNSEGIYLGCNRAFEGLYGAREADILGKTDYDFTSREEADIFRQNDQEALSAGQTLQREEWVTMAETGQRLLLQSLKTPIRDGKGSLIGVLGIGRDITEHRRLIAEKDLLQARLSQAQKMELVGRFAGGVAHDYNNMLGVILGNADLALHELPPHHPAYKRVEEIARAARHSAELTSQLLAFARQQPVDPQLLDLDEALGGMVGSLEQLLKPEHSLLWKPGGKDLKIRMDPTQLHQVLTNLAVNARDAMSGPGLIEVITSQRTLAAGEGNAWPEAPPGDYVSLRVSDTGCGMLPELAARIFEPFFTTKPTGKGTGLGLAIVHSVVKQNRGVIDVESEPGQGTTFQILFPRA